MIQVDLITGFLGAGKTTFILHYAKYLMARGLKIGILVYDHGAVNVDFPLLGQLRGEKCEIETLAGACDADCHRRRFRTKLISMGMSGYDRILIEPSGVFDIDEFFDTLNEAPLDRWYEAGNIITIVDALLGNTSSEDADFFLASQAAAAGCILLSRVQSATSEDIQQTLEHLNRAEKRIHCSVPLDKRLIIKDWASFTDDDYKRISKCGYHLADYVKTIAGKENSFQSLSFLDLKMTDAQMENRIRRLFQDRAYGNVLRVKGFFEGGNHWYEINATEDTVSILPIPSGKGAVTIIGSGLNEINISILMTGKPPEHRIL